MSNYQKALLDMTEDEVWMNLAALLGNISDIADATDKSISITVTPGKTPVLIVDGEVSKEFATREIEIPDFIGITEQLNRLWA